MKSGKSPSYLNLCICSSLIVISVSLKKIVRLAKLDKGPSLSFGTYVIHGGGGKPLFVLCERKEVVFTYLHDGMTRFGTKCFYQLSHHYTLLPVCGICELPAIIFKVDKSNQN